MEYRLLPECGAVNQRLCFLGYYLTLPVREDFANSCLTVFVDWLASCIVTRVEKLVVIPSASLSLNNTRRDDVPSLVARLSST